MIEKKDITGIILAGGRSSRMGADKGLLVFNEKPFIQYSIDALQPLVSEIIIVSNTTDYNAFKLRRISDCYENSGPLAGIYSGLKASKTNYNLVLSCDLPLMTSEILKPLIDNDDPFSEVVQIQSKGETMPLIALYKTQCKKKFYKLLLSGEKRLRVAVSKCKVKTIPLDKEKEVFTANVNTPEELKQIKDAFKD